MKNFFLFMIGISFFFASPVVLSAQEYSLDDLYKIGLEKSEEIKIAEEDLYISEREKDRAKAVLFPTLSAFGSHTRYREEEVSGFQIQPDYTNEWGLRLNQSLSLSGKEITAYRIAGEGIRKSIFELDGIKEMYLLEVANAYYEVLKAKRTVEIANANVERLTRYRDAAKTRLDVGEATKTTVLRAEAELAGAQSNMIRAENLLRRSRTALAKTVGIEGGYELKEPAVNYIFKDTDRHEQDVERLTGECMLPELDCLKETALSERADVKAARIQRDIAEDEVKFTKGSYWPDLSIEGVYRRQENDPELSFGLDESVYGALKFNFPFFEGGLTRAEVKQARARLRQAEHSLSDLKRSVTLDVEDAYLDLITVSAVINELTAEREYALDNFDAIKKQFEFGLADSLDVLDANNLLVTSERQLSSAVYNYKLAVLRLKRAAGVLLKTSVIEKTTGE